MLVSAISFVSGAARTRDGSGSGKEGPVISEFAPCFVIAQCQFRTGQLGGSHQRQANTIIKLLLWFSDKAEGTLYYSIVALKLGQCKPWALIVADER
jgi:hypothetical protein